MVKNTGKDYEEFVGNIYQSLINAEGISDVKNIQVEVNKKIEDRNGILRQFDVYWEFNIGGHTYKTVIECKDYASTVTIDKIDAFIGKTNDIPGLRLIYATKTGYQSGALKKAENHQIDLLIVREGQKEDWKAPDGTPLVNKIVLNITVLSTPMITDFSPIVDAEWLKNQADLNVDEINKKFGILRSDEIVIINKDGGNQISMTDLGSSLVNKIDNIQHGDGDYEETTDSYLTTKSGDFKIKMVGYKLKYQYNAPILTTSTLDYSQQLLGIVHNYISGKKQMIFKDGAVK